MSSVLFSQGMVLAAAMAVSGTVILLALRLQRSHDSTVPSCIISSEDDHVNKKKVKKRKKRVHFAEDVGDPTGNSDVYRKKLHSHSCQSIKYSKSKPPLNKEMPANRVALYNGILRDRVLHKFHSSY